MGIHADFLYILVLVLIQKLLMWRLGFLLQSLSCSATQRSATAAAAATKVSFCFYAVGLVGSPVARKFAFVVTACFFEQSKPHDKILWLGLDALSYGMQEGRARANELAEFAKLQESQKKESASKADS